MNKKIACFQGNYSKFINGGLLKEAYYNGN